MDPGGPPMLQSIAVSFFLQESLAWTMRTPPLLFLTQA
jgi:hypothetical protein